MCNNVLLDNILRGFTEAEQQSLISGEVVEDETGMEGTIGHTLWEYKLINGELLSRHSGTTPGCFWTDWE